ncbi:hypothetical protein GCM10010517_62950 [Streptosporangium fragile]|uniref:Molecular chaperone DnaJ n=1 Tax=Streptosporangium fragile TaxID=46186 RepID=A0ABP6IPN4_9ACTN
MTRTTADRPKRPRRTRASAPVTCADCDGERQIPVSATIGTGRRRAIFDTWAFCLTCSGSGRAPAT